MYPDMSCLICFMLFNQSSTTVHEESTQAADECWYPRVLSFYGQTENTHWSRRLDEDLKFPVEHPKVTVQSPRQLPNEDFYGFEDADAAFLDRKPVSFAIFGKPGMPDDPLATMLSVYWGCVHVSAVNGLVAGHADARTMSALRHGRAVNVAQTAARLTGLLGLGSSEVRERGYVLTGLPRHDSELSASAQINAVFTTNPPDVLIYLNCPNRDYYNYRDGLVLQSMKHDHLTQTLHFNRKFMENNLRCVKWYTSLRNITKPEYDLDSYVQQSSKVVEDVFKQFDPTFVITVDGRKPVKELFDTIKMKLMTTPLQRTVLPEIVQKRDDVLLEKYTYLELNEIEDVEDKSHESKSMASTSIEYENDKNEKIEDETTINERNERLRLMSEFGQLCPVSLSYGLFKLGNEHNCVKYMGKLYYFAGHEEMQLFYKYPKHFLEIPKSGLPIRAIFYGPKNLSNTVSKAVSNFFYCNIIDFEYIKQIQEKKEKRNYSSTIVSSILRTVQEITRIKENPSDNIRVMKNAIGDWIQLYFDNTIDSTETEGDENEYVMPQDNVNQKTKVNKFDKEKKLMHLRNFFKLYDMDFIEDLDACIHAYETMNLSKYFQNMSIKKRKMFRFNILKEKKITQLELIDVIVDNVQIKNKENKNWIIVNAPLNFLLVKKLIIAALNPIQIILFHETDPTHNLLLYGEISIRDRNIIITETFKNIKDETRSKTIKERLNYSSFTNKIENSSNIRKEKYDYFEDELEDYNEQASNNNRNNLMNIITPEIIQRLIQYTEDLFKQWHILKKHIFRNMKNHYIDCTVIKCKPDTPTNMLKTLIEDTLYHLTKFLSDNVYDVSTTDVKNTIPSIGKYNGDTSIYCPVRFANGKLSIGSKKYMAIYQNRYYYMSSLQNLEIFITNPKKYSSFTSYPKLYPKPKVSLLIPFGLDTNNLITKVLNTFNLTLINFTKILKQKILPLNIPMLGKMYEQPTLKNIIDKYFTYNDQDKDYINSLRKYIDRESTYLKNEDWIKLNSIFFQSHEGICYKNYPHNLTELKYLKENELNPNVIIEIVSDVQKEQECAKNAVNKNWSAYQHSLIDKIITRNNVTRQNVINKKSVMFKNMLIDIIKQKKFNEVKKRLTSLIEITVEEIVNGSSNSKEYTCDSMSNYINQSKSNSSIAYSKLSFISRFSELNLKQKKIIIQYELKIDDFLDLDNFRTLEQIDDQVNDKLIEDEFLIPDHFLNNNLELPSDTLITGYLSKQKNSFMEMRKFAELNGVPWITLSDQNPKMDSVTQILKNNDNVFETTFDVKLKTSEDMLRAGEIYLSKFGRWCPVQVYKNPDALQKFYEDYANNQIYPIVHRKYVYYLSGSENRKKFMSRPLKYTLEPFSWIPNFPLRIAVLGPPKSGKSYYAQKLSTQYGLQMIQIEEAIENYVMTLGWTDDSKSAVRRLRAGDTISDITLTEIVKSAMQTTQSIVQGFVLDGFPMTEKQFQQTNDSGILLHRVFVLNSSYEQCSVNNKRYDNNDIPDALLQHKFKVWTSEFVGNIWISKQFGNVTTVNDYEEMKISMLKCVQSLRKYHTKVLYENKPCRLANIPVTKFERKARMSMYLDLCPVCKVDGSYLNRPQNFKSLIENLIQYRFYFYWLCLEHVDIFLDKAKKYVDLTPLEPVTLPIITTNKELLLDVNPYLQYKSFSKYCVVCALACLWEPVYRLGKDSLMAAIYPKYIFTFCSSKCQLEFMRQPSFYSAYTMRIKEPEKYLKSLQENLLIDNLPNLGYLEQTIAIPMESALTKLKALRPLYPGLSTKTSALVFLGLYIGMNGTDDNLNKYYRKAYKQFVDTCYNFKIEIFKLKLET